MASSGKKKPTFAKLARESRQRERRLEKQARKAARKLASENQPADTPPERLGTEGSEGDQILGV